MYFRCWGVRSNQTDTQLWIGNQPVAERTKLGWIIISPAEEIDITHMLLTQTSHVDYKELCSFDVLGHTTA